MTSIRFIAVSTIYILDVFLDSFKITFKPALMFNQLPSKQNMSYTDQYPASFGEILFLTKFVDFQSIECRILITNGTRLSGCLQLIYVRNFLFTLQTIYVTCLLTKQ